MIVDPWGVVLAAAPDRETVITADLDLDQRRTTSAAPALAGQPPPAAYRWPQEVQRLMAARNPQAAADKRRLILDAAVRVFARQGFHTCRVSDIADEAGVAYGLVYHYFRSKDEVLDTLFLERWNVLLEVIREVDGRELPGARQALRDRLVHRRLLPPRPRPDEGHHRRGHAGGELVRAHATWPRSARPTS